MRNWTWSGIAAAVGAVGIACLGAPGVLEPANAQDAKAGYPFVFDSPFGIAGPKGMDPAIVKRLADAIRVAMDDPGTNEVRKKFSLEHRFMEPAAYEAFNRTLFEKERKYLIDIGLARKD